MKILIDTDAKKVIPLGTVPEPFEITGGGHKLRFMPFSQTRNSGTLERGIMIMQDDVPAGFLYISRDGNLLSLYKGSCATFEVENNFCGNSTCEDLAQRAGVI